MLQKIKFNHNNRLIYILASFAAVIIVGVLYVSLSSSKNNDFQQSLAINDTSSFSKYIKGEVFEVMDEQIDATRAGDSISQELKVILSEGSVVGVSNTTILDKAGSVQYKVGDRVVLGVLPAISESENSLLVENQPEYVIVDRYRLSGMFFIVGIFLLLAIVIGRKKGLTALVGLGITGSILLCFIAPQILAGKNPFVVALIGSGAIVLVSMFVSHGFNKRIQIAAISTIASLGLAAGLSALFVYAGQLFGFGQSDAFLLETGFSGTINLQGVLLAGIIISVLGVLDDVTTAQTAAVEELYKTDPSLSIKELYKKGLSIGREHIASLINTLILVYAGAALPLFLLLTLQKSQPIWVLLNSEFISEEIARSLVGSTALILAVPISTLLAAYLYAKKTKTSD